MDVGIRRNAPEAGHHRRMLAVMIAAYVATYAALSLLKYRFYLYDVFDLAIFVQALDGIPRGTLFSSLRGMSWLGDHSSLILFPLAPPFMLFRHPATLLVVQSLALGLGAIPVFGIARRELGSERAGLIAAAVYLAYPALGYVNLYEFHPEALAVPLLLGLVHDLGAGAFGRSLVWGLLALATREDAGFVVAGIGLWASLTAPRARGAGLALICLSAVSLLLTFMVLSPALDPGRADFSLLYPDWGRTLGEVAASVVRRPFEALSWLFRTPGDPADTSAKLGYHVQMLLPFAFLSLLAPELLVIAIPILLELFLTRAPEQHTIFQHYTALVIPVYAMAAIMGMARIPRVPRLRAVAAAGVLACTLVSQVAFGPLPAANRDLPGRLQPVLPTAYDRVLRPWRDRMVRELPARGPVVASFEFQARLVGRPEPVHSMHHILSGHYSISRERYVVPDGILGVLGHFDPERTLASVDGGTGARMRGLIARNRLRLIDAADGLMLWVRDTSSASIETFASGTFATDTSARVRFDRSLELLGAELPTNPVRAGGVLPVRIVWRRSAPESRIAIVHYILIDGSGRAVLQRSLLLGTPVDPVSSWPDGRVRTTDRLILPADLAPGACTLAVRVAFWDQRSLSVATTDPPLDRSRARLGSVRIAGRPITSR